MATPTSQLLSRTLYDTDGVTTVWDFSFSGGYLDPAHVRAYVEDPLGIRTDIVVTEPMLIGEFQLQITPALAAGNELVIYRDTPKDLPLVDFTDEAGFSEVSLDTNAKQAVFIAAEAIDTVNATEVSAAIGAAQLAVEAQLAAEASEAAALASQVAAAASAAAALVSENAAELAEANTEAALTDALTIYGSIAAVEAAAAAADASADAADVSEAAALASQVAAAASASAAAGSASSASTDATAASGAAISAASSATTAAGHASAALTSANNADISEAAADASEAAAAASAASSAASLASVVSTVANFMGRNKIINGKMEFAQRGTSFATATGYTLDRWTFGTAGGALCTIAQALDNPTADTTYSLRLTVTTADAAMAAGDVNYIEQPIEGYNARDLIDSTFTLSFTVRSSKVGTHCVAFRNGANDRSYVVEYTVNAANVYEQKTVTVPGGITVTGGGWGFLNLAGIRVAFCTGLGTTYQTSPGAWQTGNFLGTPNQVNCMDTIGNVFAIARVQLEVGTVASPFEHRHYSVERILCERYYQAFTKSAGDLLRYCAAASSNVYAGAFHYRVQMRALPTTTLVGTPAYTNCSGIQFLPEGDAIWWRVTTGGAGGYFVNTFSVTANAEIT